MQLGGVAVEDRLIRDLAGLVQGPIARKLESALLFRAKIVALTTDERAAILRALEDAPEELQSVREALLADERWRMPRGRLA